MELFYTLNGAKRVVQLTPDRFRVEMFFDGGWDVLAIVCTLDYALAKLFKAYD